MVLAPTLGLLVPAAAQVAPAASALKEFKSLSIEELMDIEVRSVSRRSKKLSETASGIQVITDEAIRRSGAITLPEALRLAGTLQIAQRQGDLHRGYIEQAIGKDAKLTGGNLLARWARPLSSDAKLQIQSSYAYSWRWASDTFADRLETFDFDAQHEFGISERHRVIRSANYRFWVDHVRTTRTQAFIPADDSIRLAGLFAHDEIQLVPERLRLGVGAKFEHNDYSGSDFQPGARHAWLANNHTFWAAASRAVRTPSRLDRDFHQPPSPPFLVAGGPEFTSETLWAYELGWRGQPTARLGIALTVFQHDYDDLRSVEPNSPTLLPFRSGNGVAGRTIGAETSADFRLRLKPGNRDLNQATAATSDPSHQFQLRSSLDLPGHVEFDLALRRVGRVPVFVSGVAGFVPAYTELDARRRGNAGRAASWRRSAATSSTPAIPRPAPPPPVGKSNAASGRS